MKTWDLHAFLRAEVMLRNIQVTLVIPCGESPHPSAVRGILRDDAIVQPRRCRTPRPQKKAMTPDNTDDIRECQK
jgi:hypothetical protein